MGNREKCVYIIPAFLDQIDCRSQFDCLWLICIVSFTLVGCSSLLISVAWWPVPGGIRSLPRDLPGCQIAHGRFDFAGCRDLC